MTKTDWTVHEIREMAKALGIASCVSFHPDFKNYPDYKVWSGDASKMLAAFAERIAADERAVPVAEMRKDDVGSRYYVPFNRDESLRLYDLSDGTKLFTNPPAQAAQVARPCRIAAERSVTDFLKEQLGEVPAFELEEDGEDHWSFWVTEDDCDDDTTSYVHADLSIEWYGTAWEAPTAEPTQEKPGWKVPERLSGGLATLMPEVLIALRRDGYHYSLIKDIELLLAASPTPPKEN